MLFPNKLLNNQEYLEFHLRDLQNTRHVDLAKPVVVQLCGNDPEEVVQAGRKLQHLCEGIDLNLGCPQTHAKNEHIGGYLLGQKDWPLIEQIVSSMSQSFTTPVSAKLRLCQPTSSTLTLASRIEASGASWLALHARHCTSTKKRRAGPAYLDQVKILKDNLTIPIISNGNVRVYQDLNDNLRVSGADGVMVGETLLGNPSIFSGKQHDPINIALEYLTLCQEFPDTVTLENIRTHIRHIIEFNYSRKTWYKKFRIALSSSSTIEDLYHLLARRTQRWRGRSLLPLPTSNSSHTISENVDEDEDSLSEEEEIGVAEVDLCDTCFD